MEELTHEQWRSLVLETIKDDQVEEMNSLQWAVAATARKWGFIKGDEYAGSGKHKDMLGRGEYGTVQDIMWDLIIEGVVRPGRLQGDNLNLPFFHVTEWGKAVIKDGPTSPYDPDGYLKRLEANIPSLDSVVITYLNESMHTFRINCLLSSTVSLGCASEKALLLLIEAYGDSLKNHPAEQKKFREAQDGAMISRRFRQLRQAFEADLKKRLPRNISEGLDVELDALFDSMRQQRNDAGHPTGNLVERERAYANLVVFPVYLRKVYQLIDWLASNSKP